MNGEDPNAVNVKEASPEDAKRSQGLSETGALETEDESVLYFTQKIVEVEKELDQVVERTVLSADMQCRYAIRLGTAVHSTGFFPRRVDSGEFGKCSYDGGCVCTLRNMKW